MQRFSGVFGNRIRSLRLDDVVRYTRQPSRIDRVSKLVRFAFVDDNAVDLTVIDLFEPAARPRRGRSAAGSHRTRRWREQDSNPRSPGCGLGASGRARRDPRRQREVGKEHAIEQGKILRACQREHVVARSKRRGRRSAASDPIPNHHQNARRGRERQRASTRLPATVFSSPSRPGRSMSGRGACWSGGASRSNIRAAVATVQPWRISDIRTIMNASGRN
jgi:hypothetical protein